MIQIRKEIIKAIAGSREKNNLKEVNKIETYFLGLNKRQTRQKNNDFRIVFTKKHMNAIEKYANVCENNYIFNVDEMVSILKINCYLNSIIVNDLLEILGKKYNIKGRKIGHDLILTNINVRNVVWLDNYIKDVVDIYYKNISEIKEYEDVDKDL